MADKWRALFRDACLIQSLQYMDMAAVAQEGGHGNVAGELIGWAIERLSDWRKAVNNG